MSAVIDTTAQSLRELAEKSSAWPFEEAKKIVARLPQATRVDVADDSLAAGI